jgi:hypothetical protein
MENCLKQFCKHIFYTLIDSRSEAEPLHLGGQRLEGQGQFGAAI